MWVFSFGATTLATMTFSITTLSITIRDTQYNNTQHLVLSVVNLNAGSLGVILLLCWVWWFFIVMLVWWFFIVMLSAVFAEYCVFIVVQHIIILNVFLQSLVCCYAECYFKCLSCWVSCYLLCCVSLFWVCFYGMYSVSTVIILRVLYAESSFLNFILSVIILSVFYAEAHVIYCHAECHYTECFFMESLVFLCHSECHNNMCFMLRLVF